MPESPSKERFSLKLPEDLLDELRAEAESQGTSPTQLIEQALRERHTNKLTTDEYIARALRLCPACDIEFRRLAALHKGGTFAVKVLRGYLWEKLGFWTHGKYEDGCPGWEQNARLDPEELRKIQDAAAEDILNTPADKLGVR